MEPLKKGGTRNKHDFGKLAKRKFYFKKGKEIPKNNRRLIKCFKKQHILIFIHCLLKSGIMEVRNHKIDRSIESQ
jgi:hypothetical protein